MLMFVCPCAVHTIPFMYGLRGGVTSSDGSGVFDKASARGLKIDLDYLEEELSKRQGTLAGNGQIGAADVSILHSAWGARVMNSMRNLSPLTP